MYTLYSMQRSGKQLQGRASRWPGLAFRIRLVEVDILKGESHARISWQEPQRTGAAA